MGIYSPAKIANFLQRVFFHFIHSWVINWAVMSETANPSRSVNPVPFVSSESTEGSSKLNRWGIQSSAATIQKFWANGKRHAPSLPKENSKLKFADFFLKMVDNQCLSNYFKSVERFVNDILVSSKLTKCLKQRKSDLKLILI